MRKSIMELAIGLLTLVLVIDSLFLMLLILIQLPKKEAGAGLAFGAGATDALFGAGSGTALSKITKYSAGIFLVLALTLSVMRTHHAKTSARIISTEIEKKASATAPAPAPATLPPAVTLPVLPGVASNLSAAGATGTVAAPAATIVTNVEAPLPVVTNNPGSSSPAPNR